MEKKPDINHPLYYKNINISQTDTATDTYKKIKSTFESNLIQPVPENKTKHVKLFLSAINNLIYSGTEYGPESFSWKRDDNYEYGTLDLDKQIKIKCNITITKMSSQFPVLANIIYASDSIKRFGRKRVIPDQKKVAKKLKLIKNNYEQWLVGDGLPQWPQEFWLNSKAFGGTEYLKKAPRRQWVFLRPNIGTELSYSNQEDADVVGSFAIEPIGHVWYLGDEGYKRKVGVSALATLGTSNGAGYGVMLRWNEYWAGYTFKSGDNSDALFVGIDIYKYFNKKENRENMLSNTLERITK